MKPWIPKLAVSVSAVALIVVRFFWPAAPIDPVTLGLLVVLALPWVGSFIKKAELPGGWKIEFQDVKSAIDDVTGPGKRQVPPSASTPSFVVVGETDPRLALAGLRIEIEMRVRQLAEQKGLPDDRSLMRTIDRLAELGALSTSERAGLVVLIAAGNQAVHGGEINPSAAAPAIAYGPQVLATLDSKLS